MTAQSPRFSELLNTGIQYPSVDSVQTSRHSFSCSQSAKQFKSELNKVYSTGKVTVHQHAFIPVCAGRAAVGKVIDMKAIYETPFVIAEAGCNHKGEMSIAKDLIATAALFCKADAIKFQKRCNRELLTPEQYNAPHPNPVNSYGKTYGEHREFLEFTVDQHRQLKVWCEEFGIVYSTSVWDLTSAKEITSLKPQFIKIPSACNNNFAMLQWLCDNYEGEIQVSFGMTTLAEEQQIVDLFLKNGRTQDLVIFCCTSGYPVPYEDVCLLELQRLTDTFGGTVKKIGFSGHHLGTAVDIAAFTLGAQMIERHYTLDKTWKGTDHAASLEPDEFKKLVQDLCAVRQALQRKMTEILPIEQVQRDKLKYRGN